MQKRSVRTSIIGMKKRVTLRCGMWIMVARPVRGGSSLPALFLRTAQRQDEPPADEDHPRREDVDQGHEQAASGGRQGGGVELDDPLGGGGAGDGAERLQDAADGAD